VYSSNDLHHSYTTGYSIGRLRRLTDTIDIRIQGRHGSISDLEWLNVPSFAVITGVNGTGKSQLLEVVARSYGALHYPHAHDPRARRQFDAHATIDGLSLEPGEVFHAYAEWFPSVQGESSEEVVKSYIDSLHNQLTRANHGGFEAGLPWLLEQLGITTDSAKELSKRELFELLTPGLLYGLMARVASASNPGSSQVGWALLFLAYRLFERDALGLRISREEVERRYGEPPWVLLNEILETSGLPFRAVYPDELRPTALVDDDTFALRLRDVERDVEAPFDGLSSGERVIMSTVLWQYDAQQIGKHHRFLLLDEPDSHLHPSLTRRFLDVIRKVFVEERGVRVIMTTHSPSTVALAPEESLFEMRRQDPRIQPVGSKARAVATLTDGFVAVQEATQTVLLEGKDDPPFYERVWELLTERSSVSDPGPLEPFPSVAFVYGKGKETVEELIPQMRDRGLQSFHGIIDKDISNAPSNGVHVIKRNGMENYLYDPLNIWVLLRSQGQAPTVTGVDLPRGREARVRDLSEHDLQRIVDVVLAKVAARLTNLSTPETATEDIFFVNGKRLRYPRWFLDRDDKEIKEEFSKAYGHRWLRPDNPESLLRSYATLNMVPKDLLNLFRAIQASGHPK
jgi:predicted ATPase